MCLPGYLVEGAARHPVRYQTYNSDLIVTVGLLKEAECFKLTLTQISPSPYAPKSVLPAANLGLGSYESENCLH